MKPRILFVDDEPNILASYSRILRQQWDVKTAGGGEEGLKIIEAEEPFAVVVSDFQMPRMDGVTFLSRVREKSPDTVRMMLTGEGGYEVAIHAVNEGNIFRLLTKPCPSEQLIKALNAGVSQFNLIQIAKEAREKEIHIACEIQKNLLLGTPPEGIRGGLFAARTIPSLGVDGDFIDFIDHNETCVDVIIGDVMGKGIPAALIGAGAKSRFSRELSRLFSRQDSHEIPEPEIICQNVHAGISRYLEALGSYMTGSYSRFDFKKKTITFVDAGHPPTLFFSKSTGRCLGLKGEFFPFGFPMYEPFRQKCVSFESGDIFLFLSDGLIDCRNAQNEFFGTERIEKLLGEFQHLPPEEIIQALFDRVNAFAGGEDYGDDLSCIVVKIE